MTVSVSLEDAVVHRTSRSSAPSHPLPTIAESVTNNNAQFVKHVAALLPIVHVALLVVVLSMLSPREATSQEGTVLSARLGETIDSDERQYFNLLSRVDDFQSAWFERDGPEGGRLIVRRTARRDTSISLSSALVEQLQLYIERHDDPAYVTEQLDWDLLTGTVAYAQRMINREPTEFTLVDGQSVTGTLAWVEDGTLYVLPNQDAYDWRRDRTPLARIQLSDVADIGPGLAVELGRAARSGVRRNILVPIALIAFAAVGNGSADPGNPGFIGGLSASALGAVFSLQSPTTRSAAGGPPYPTISEPAIQRAIRDHALFRTLVPPDLLESAEPIDIAVDESQPQPPRHRRWRAPHFRGRIGFAAPYVANQDVYFSHYRSEIVAGNSPAELSELEFDSPWEVDVAARLVGPVILGARAIVRSAPDVPAGVEYFRGKMLQPYIELSYGRTIGSSAGFSRGLMLSVSGGPTLGTYAVEHEVRWEPLVGDQDDVFDSALSSYTWKSTSVAGSIALSFELSRFASLAVRYTRWYGVESVPARSDVLTVGTRSVVLHDIEAYDVAMMRETIRFGVDLSI